MGSSSTNTAASVRSVSVRGGSLRPVVLTAGRGSAGRFSLPDSVFGIASSTVVTSPSRVFVDSPVTCVGPSTGGDHNGSRDVRVAHVESRRNFEAVSIVESVRKLDVSFRSRPAQLERRHDVRWERGRIVLERLRHAKLRIEVLSFA